MARVAGRVSTAVDGDECGRRDGDTRSSDVKEASEESVEVDTEARIECADEGREP
jgi:hypothetical protein